MSHLQISKTVEDDDWIYCAGVDVARGGHESADSKDSSDDFAISTIRFKPDYPKQLVHHYRASGIELSQMSARVHRQHLRFNYGLIMVDPGGGGVFLGDELRKPIQNDGREAFNVKPLITDDDAYLAGTGEPILAYFRRGEPKLDAISFRFRSESHLPNKAHELLKSALQHKNLVLPVPWAGWERERSEFSSADQARRWINTHEGLSGRDLVAAEIDLAAMQLIQIEREADCDGTPRMDRHGNFRFISKRKKDSAYALLYANFAAHVYQQLHLMDIIPVKGEAEFIISSDSF